MIRHTNIHVYDVGGSERRHEFGLTLSFTLCGCNVFTLSPNIMRVIVAMLVISHLSTYIYRNTEEV